MMWDLKNRFFKGAVALALVSGLSGCSLSGKDGDPSLHIDLSALEGQGSRFALLNAGGGFLGLTSPPTSASNFSCYAVNVTGPGIVESGGGSNNSDPMVEFYRTMNEPGRYCSYRGVVTPPLYLGATGSSEATLQIPPGGVRLVQIVGVNDSVVCASGVIDDPVGSSTNSSSGGRFFEIGRSVLNDVFGDRSVNIGMNWPTTAALQAARSMDCGGGCALLDKFNAGSIPASFGTITKYAQRIPSNPGKYIRSIDLNMTIGVADTVTVTIYQSTSAAAVPASPTSFSTAKTVFASTSGIFSFDMYSAANHYLQMQAGLDYWIVVTSPASTGNQNQWKYLVGAGGDGVQFSGTWSAMGTNAGFDFRINQCAN